MKKLKRWIALPLALISVFSAFSLAACGESEGKTDDDKNQEDPFEEDDLPSSYVDKSKLTYISSLDSYKKTDWQAKWIWSGSSQKNSYSAFRKTFTLDEKPTKANTCIAAENSYWLWVNGELVVYDGGYKRGPTTVDTYYQEIDLAPYLVKGKNTVVALVSYFGRTSTSATSAGEAGFLFEMDLGSKKIVSDKTFKAQRLTAYKNDRLLKNDYPDYKLNDVLTEWNCYYDARDGVGDYFSPDFDDSDWKNATVVANVGTEPFNDTYLCVSPFFAFDKEYTDLSAASQYIGVTFDQKTTIDIDMGTNRQFSPYFELDAKSEGLRITYYTDTFTTSGLNSFKDDYVTKQGSQSYESYPWRTGKHLIVEVPAGVTFRKIAVRYNEFDTKEAGSFTSSDAQLDQLWQEAVNTVRIDMRDTFMDCPERERSPWAGDLGNMIPEAMYSLDENAGKLIQKTILSYVGWAQSGTGTAVDNVLPLRVPCMKVTEWPAQDLALLNAFYDYYLHSGDAETLKLFYPMAKEYLKLWKMKDNGLIEYRQGDSTWADWGEGFVDNEIIQNCQYYMALKDCLAWAEDFGKTEDVAFYRDRMESMQKAFRSVYLKEGGFTSKTEYDDRANAMAVVSGLAQAEDYGKVTAVLATVKNCSVYMERYVQEALCMMGEYDLNTARTKERYALMLTDEYDTLWERFVLEKDGDPFGDGSPNHGWAGGPIIMLNKYYAGVRPTSAGFEKYVIEPQTALDSFTCVTPTPKGNITVSLKKEGGKVVITVDTISSDGTIILPVKAGQSVSVSGKAEKTGNNTYRVSGGNVTFTIG